MAATPVKSPMRQLNEDAVGSDNYLASLSSRIEVLEKKLLGNGRLKVDQPSLYPTVQAMQQKLADCLGIHNKATVYSLWSKIDSLEGVLHPNFIQNITSADTTQCGAKEDLLVGYAKQLEMMTSVAQVDELQQLKDYVNTTKFQGLENHEKQLAGVVRRHADQERSVEEITGKVQVLLKAYHQIMLQLSAQCIAWDEDLDRREQSTS